MEPSDFIKIYSQHDGTPGYQFENWYARNTTNNRAIRITVLFWTGVLGGINTQWTKVFDLEPGETILIGTKSQFGSSPVNAALKGARYL
jgi:hypothetical protein